MIRVKKIEQSKPGKRATRPKDRPFRDRSYADLSDKEKDSLLKEMAVRLGYVKE